jgi:hypothetical protein
MNPRISNKATRAGDRPDCNGGKGAVDVPAHGWCGEVPAMDHRLDRTVLAAERTLRAWIRSAISLIGFGFTL